MQAALTVIVLLCLALAAWGWGKSFAGWAGTDEGGWAYPIAVGVAVLIALGGLLNLMRLAYAPVLGLLLAAGWVQVWRRRTSMKFPPSWIDTLIFSGFATHALFLSPAGFFNQHDDFHLYLPDPARMLATGSLGGDPFAWLGGYAQGAQGFLQSFVLMARPFTHIYVFDAALCLALTAGLAAQLARRLGAGPGSSAAAAMSVFLVPAQAVNVSALYSAGALALACVMAALPLAHDWETLTPRSAARRAATLGLLSAAMIALKTTMAPLAALFLVPMLLLSSRRGGYRRALAAAGGVTAAASIAMLPWLLTHKGVFLPQSLSLDGAAAKVAAGFPSLWSVASTLEPRVYGGSVLVSCVFAGLLALISLRVLLEKRGAVEGVPAAIFCAATAALLPAYLTLYAKFGWLDIDSVLRYWVPASLAGVPVGIILLSRFLAVGRARVLFWTILAVPTLLLGPAFSARMKRLFSDRSVLAYPYTRNSVMSMNGFLSGRAAERLRSAQADVPAGEALLAWISAPFYLDFRRNSVFIVSEGGLTGPRFDWLDDTLPGEAAATHLGRLGVRYILWQQVGLGVKSERSLEEYRSSNFSAWRRTGERQLALRRILAFTAVRHRVLRDDAGLLVIDLARPADR